MQRTYANLCIGLVASYAGLTNSYTVLINSYISLVSPTSKLIIYVEVKDILCES